LKDIIENILDDSDFESEIPSDGNKITLVENRDKIECLIKSESKDLTHSIVEIDLINLRTIIRPINTLIESVFISNQNTL